jgi:hypothetical protein
MSDSLTTAENALCDTLADSEVFRALVGVETYEAARAHIFVDDLSPPEGDLRTYTEGELARRFLPYALVATAAEGFVHKAVGFDAFVDSGKLTIAIDRHVPVGGDPMDRDWKQWVGRLLADMLSLSSQSENRPHLAIAQIRITDGPGRYVPAKEVVDGELQRVQLSVEWGADA